MSQDGARELLLPTHPRRRCSWCFRSPIPSTPPASDVAAARFAARPSGGCQRTPADLEARDVIALSQQLCATDGTSTLFGSAHGPSEPEEPFHADVFGCRLAEYRLKAKRQRRAP